MMFRIQIRRLLAASVCLTLAGCAAVGTEPNPADPWEGSNRNMYAVNDAVDKAIIRPVAELYSFLIPRPVRTCVNNVFVNITEPWSGLNSIMQERGHEGINTFGRFLLNTTAGIGGCIDVASMNGLPRVSNDFGVTLGVWGVPSGPYLVLPLIGSSTIRDGVGDLANLYGNQIVTIGLIKDVPLRNSLWGLEFVSRRDALLPISKTVDSAALDPYSFVRDAYLQRREAMIRGNIVEAQDLPDYEDFEAVDADKKALGVKKEKSQ